MAARIMLSRQPAPQAAAAVLALAMGVANMLSVTSMRLSSTCSIPNGWTAKNTTVNGRAYVILQPPLEDKLQMEGTSLPYERTATFSGHCRFDVHGARVHFSGGCSLSVDLAQDTGSSVSITSMATESWDPTSPGLSRKQPHFRLKFESRSRQTASSTLVFRWNGVAGGRWSCLVYTDFMSGLYDTGILTSDVDECQSDFHRCNRLSETCVNTFGSYCCSLRGNDSKSGLASSDHTCSPPPFTPSFPSAAGAGTGGGGKTNAAAIAVPTVIVLVVVVVAVVVVKVKGANGGITGLRMRQSNAADDTQDGHILKEGDTPSRPGPPSRTYSGILKTPPRLKALRTKLEIQVGRGWK